ncbi:MAG: hypothetical protein ABR956_00020 [Terracidiphilus sp.]|jgi:hypothetical protein
MRKFVTFCSLLFLTLSIGQKAIAQDAAKTQDAAKATTAPAHYYHLDFVLQELDADGKPVNSRTYSTTLTTDKNDSNTSIRTGNKVPIITGASPRANGPDKEDIQYQYQEVGIGIDARDAHLAGNLLAFVLSAQVSSIAPPSGSSTIDDPVIRANKWQSSVLIPLGKPTVVFRSDALESKGSMQLVVTAMLIG